MFLQSSNKNSTPVYKAEDTTSSSSIIAEMMSIYHSNVGVLYANGQGSVERDLESRGTKQQHKETCEQWAE